MVILATKITRPQVRSQLVARPRLFALLDQITERPLILLSAPAGFGKTTLLVAWASQNTVPVTWFSLDDGDNDPERFLAHLIPSAIQQDGTSEPPRWQCCNPRPTRRKTPCSAPSSMT